MTDRKSAEPKDRRIPVKKRGNVQATIKSIGFWLLVAALVYWGYLWFSNRSSSEIEKRLSAVPPATWEFATYDKNRFGGFPWRRQYTQEVEIEGSIMTIKVLEDENYIAVFEGGWKPDYNVEKRGRRYVGAYVGNFHQIHLQSSPRETEVKCAGRFWLSKDGFQSDKFVGQKWGGCTGGSKQDISLSMER